MIILNQSSICSLLLLPIKLRGADCEEYVLIFPEMLCSGTGRITERNVSKFRDVICQKILSMNGQDFVKMRQYSGKRQSEEPVIEETPPSGFSFTSAYSTTALQSTFKSTFHKIMFTGSLLQNTCE